MRTMLERLQEAYYIEVPSLKCVDCGRALNTYPTYEASTIIRVSESKTPINTGIVTTLVSYPKVLCGKCCIRRAGFTGRLG